MSVVVEMNSASAHITVLASFYIGRVLQSQLSLG